MKRGRARRVALLVALALGLSVAAVAVHVRLGVGPEVATAPLLREERAAAVLFQDVAVFTGVEDHLREHQDVFVEGPTIKSIGPTGAAPPAGARVIDGRGRTLLPGYVDAHTHLFGAGAPPWAPARVSDAHALEAYLFHGVTTVYVLGGLGSQLRDHRDRIGRGEALGPRIRFAHVMVTAPGGHPLVVGGELTPWPISAVLGSMIPQPTTAAEAEAAVATMAAESPDFIKVIIDSLPPSAPRIDAAVVDALVNAAHRRGLKVFAHVGAYEDAQVALAAGVDALAHGVYRGRLSGPEVEAIARAGRPMIFTLAGFEISAEMIEGRFEPSALDRASTPAAILDTVTGAAGREFAASGAFAEFAAELEANAAHWRPNLLDLHRAGVRLLVGTDSPLPGIFQGSSYHHELLRSHAAGIPAAALLRAATHEGAALLGLDNEIGEVASGKAADLVLVRGDPLTDLRAAGEVEAVMAGGRLLWPAAP